METVRSLVQNIIVIVILAVFLEMLLPAGEMRRYIRLVMGMLVIMAVLQAAAGLVGNDFNLEMPDVFAAAEPPARRLDDILEEGANLFESQQQDALEQYKKGLAKQVAGLARLNGEARVAGVNVLVEENPRAPDYGRIKEIHLTLAALDTGKSSNGQDSGIVEPVRIEVKGNVPGGGVGNENISGRAGQDWITGSFGKRSGENAGWRLEKQAGENIDGQSVENTEGQAGKITGEQPEQQSVISLIHTLADFYNIPADRVKVEYQQ